MLVFWISLLGYPMVFGRSLYDVCGFNILGFCIWNIFLPYKEEYEKLRGLLS